MRRLLLAVVVCLVPVLAPLVAAEAETPGAAEVIEKVGARRGICVVLGDKDGKLAVDLARRGELTVFVQLPDAAAVAAARRAADAAGFYGKRIFVDEGSGARVHLADNVADVLVVAGGAAETAKEEVLRVLRPGGTALVGGEEYTKPLPEGTDDWSHHYRGPDNNPQSTDRLARAPYLTQFIVEPRYGPCPQACVASGGRVFMAFGHVAWHEREEPWLNTLVALNGYNGAALWKRALPAGIMVDRGTIVATPTTLYLADHESCKLMDAATGKVTGQIAPPAELTGGTFWKWIALSDGVLYALVGKPDPMDPTTRWRRRHHGWPWGGISKGYNEPEYRWGFARTLLAIDPKTRKVLWHYQTDPPIDSRALCMSNGRIYLCSFGSYLACLDAKSGKEIWRKAGDEAAALFKKVGPFSKGHGYRTGWKSTIYLRCSDKALYFSGPQVHNLTAVAAENGSYLWSRKAQINMHVVIRDDGLYSIGGQGTRGQTHKLDPMTGEVLAKYEVSRRACTRVPRSR